MVSGAGLKGLPAACRISTSTGARRLAPSAMSRCRTSTGTLPSFTPGRGTAIIIDATAAVDRRLRRRQPCDRHAERRTGDVIEADRLATANRGWIHAVFAANAELHVVARLPTTLRCYADQLPYAVEIKRDKGIMLDDALAQISRDIGSRIVARHAEGRLCQIVGAEGEKLGRFGDQM